MRFFIILYSLIVISIVFRCKDSSTISGITEQEELIVNGSFEYVGIPSLDGWHQSHPDTAFAKFSTDAAPDGGLYSISLSNDWGPVPELLACLPAPPGTHHYRLSVWSKSLAFAGYPIGAIGGVRIYHQTADSVIYRKWVGFSDSLWTEHTLLDTINCTQGDSLIVSLITGHGQWSYGRTLFDRVSFLKLD